jgi:hypothetical protein
VVSKGQDTKGFLRALERSRRQDRGGDYLQVKHTKDVTYIQSMGVKPPIKIRRKQDGGRWKEKRENVLEQLFDSSTFSNLC